MLNKYRYWNIEKGVMVYANEDDSASYWDGVCASEAQVVNNCLSQKRFLDNNKIWMPWTGLKDRNKKDIYLDDFLGNEQGNFLANTYAASVKHWLVGFDAGCFMAGRDETIPKGMNTYLFLVCDRLEVTGSRWENPNFLTAKGWNEKDMPKTKFLLNGEIKQCHLNRDGIVNCGFCGSLIANRHQRITVTDKCKCGAEVIDL